MLLLRNECEIYLRMAFSILNDFVRSYSWWWLCGDILEGFGKRPETCAQTLGSVTFRTLMLSCSECGIREFPREFWDFSDRVALVRVEGHKGWAITRYVRGTPFIWLWEELYYNFASVQRVHLSGQEWIGDVNSDLGAWDLLSLALMRCMHLGLWLKNGIIAWRVTAIVLTENEITVERSAL